MVSFALDHAANWNQRPPETRVPDSTKDIFFPGHHWSAQLLWLPTGKTIRVSDSKYPNSSSSLPYHPPQLPFLPYHISWGHKWKCDTKGPGGPSHMLRAASLGISLVKSPGSRTQVSTTAKQKGDIGSIMYHEWTNCVQHSPFKQLRPIKPHLKDSLIFLLNHQLSPGIHFCSTSSPHGPCQSHVSCSQMGLFASTCPSETHPPNNLPKGTFWICMINSYTVRRVGKG